MNATTTINPMDAIPMSKVSEYWERWQRGNPKEAAEIVATFTDIAIRRDFWMANGWLVSRIHEATGAPKHLIREYMRANARD